MFLHSYTVLIQYVDSIVIVFIGDFWIKFKKLHD